MTLIGVFVWGFLFFGFVGVFCLFVFWLFLFVCLFVFLQVSFPPLKSHTNVWIYNVA